MINKLKNTNLFMDLPILEYFYSLFGPTTIYIYIYIYIYANFVKHNRHFMPTYFLLDPFEFPYYFYRIQGN